MTLEPLLTHPDRSHPIRRRGKRYAQPRFKIETTKQLDVVVGCPELAVAEDHLARKVAAVVARFDLSEVESQYSSLGRHGYHPRNILCVWIYASLVGLHESTKLARALKTDAALRLLSGGHAISEGTLRRFRRENRETFAQLLAQTVRLAKEAGLLKVDELAVDSWRLRADASLAAVGSLARSTARLVELASLDAAKLTSEQLARHNKSVEKHQAIVNECSRRNRTNIVRTSPSAGLLKFPYGAAAPGHRVTVTAAGASERIVVSVFLDAAPTDHGHLGQAIDGALATLDSINALAGKRPRAAADAGYGSATDLIYAADNAHRIDVYVPDQNETRETGFFGRERFVIVGDVVTCPAGRTMQGPIKDGSGNVRYLGVACAACDLLPRCTKSKQRSIAINPEYERAKLAMKTRMAEPDAVAVYKKRLPTIEAVFSNIEDSMGYRRASARVERSVVAEVLLKILAHNISRLLSNESLEALVVDFEIEF